MCEIPANAEAFVECRAGCSLAVRLHVIELDALVRSVDQRLDPRPPGLVRLGQVPGLVRQQPDFAITRTHQKLQDLVGQLFDGMLRCIWRDLSAKPESSITKSLLSVITPGGTT